MNKKRIVWSMGVLAAGALVGLGYQPASAQFPGAPGGLPGAGPAGVAPRGAARKAVDPERELLRVRLGRPMLEVVRRFGAPSEVQTVALVNPAEQLPALGGAPGAMGGPEGAMSGYPGMPGAPGAMGAPPGYPGATSAAGGSGAFGMAGGIPTLSPGSGPAGYPGVSMAPGAGYPGMPGAMPGMPGEGAFGAEGGGLPGAGQQLPEFSTAVLWIYKRNDVKGGKDTVRLEFLINEDGRVAQIAVAAPAGKSYPGVKTSKGVALNSSYQKVLEAYGFPEKTRLLPGFRFMEAYYTKNYHAAFTFDMQKPNMPCVRLTIALAD